MDAELVVLGLDREHRVLRQVVDQTAAVLGIELREDSTEALPVPMQPEIGSGHQVGRSMPVVLTAWAIGRVDERDPAAGRGRRDRREQSA